MFGASPKAQINLSGAQKGKCARSPCPQRQLIGSVADSQPGRMNCEAGVFTIESGVVDYRGPKEIGDA